MVKKIGSAGLLLGGLLSATGIIVIFTQTVSAMSVEMIKGLAIMARIGAVLMLASAITALVGASLGGFRKGGAIVALIFSIFAFVAQIMITPLISSVTVADTDGRYALIGSTAIGMVTLLVTGAVCFIMGIVGICKKTTPNG